MKTENKDYPLSEPFLIMGLGNPGMQYALTRHNIGFMCVDYLARAYDIPMKRESKMNAMVGKGMIQGQKVILSQPLTYMNLSGEAYQKLIQYYHLPFERTLVLYDDIDLPFGRIRFRPSGSPGTHNGMRSIFEATGQKEIPRLRIGINTPLPMWDLANYVLANFSDEEKQQLPHLLKAITEAVAYWVASGSQSAMNRYNALDLLPAESELPKEP